MSSAVPSPADPSSVGRITGWPITGWRITGWPITGAATASLRRWPLRWAAAAVVALLLIVAMVAEARSPAPTKRAPIKPSATTAPPRATTPPSRLSPTSSPAIASSTASASAAPSPSLVVPVDLIGKNYDQAAAAVRTAGLTPQRRDMKDGHPTGTVVEVQPDPGKRLEPGAVVTLWTSSGDRGHGKKKDGEGGD